MCLFELAMLKKMGGKGGASVELDTTLTQAGKAADAKAVGDRLAEIGNGGGGASGGLSIKKIEFTDRPSAYAWLLANSNKVLKTVISTNQIPVPFTFTNISLIDEYDSPSIEFSLCKPSVTLGKISVNTARVRILHDYYTEITSGYIGEDYELTQIPEEYWAFMELKVTVYYID